ncbi:MAG: acyl-CoA thioesterase [Bacteroidota bacterium]
MYTHQTQIRVRYSETDRMNYVYYGNYAQYFEVARVEALRSLGVSYKKLEEEEGVLLPVLDFQIKYFKPAYYDELLTIQTTITQMPQARIYFEYEILNEKNEIINKASTTLVFVRKNTGKPMMAPESLLSKLQSYFV